MNNLYFKDLKLAIHPVFFILPLLTGALMLIPGWLYFLVLLYFCFITVPNMFATFKSQNDLMFSIMMPVRKKDIVKSRILSVITLELLHIIIAVGYALININIYDNTKYIFLNPNMAFFGFVFIMFAIFNIILFPMFYKTGYKYGAPVIVSTGTAIIFVTGAELLSLFHPDINMCLKSTDSKMVSLQLGILVGGIIIFALSAVSAYKLSLKKFVKVDV